MDLARAPRRRPLTARKKGSGYENEVYIEAKKTILFMFVKLCLFKCKCVLKKENHSVFLGDSPQ